ncbi:GtrA family protein [Paenibacillus sp. N4]|uniref:GtrA family protein n=1 Tax=Paenibacillus vietnamensis TaxID=2590547 RepID=UPI001CD0F0FA|nr:GtrA family protein [Paenibacillus vietnamensis]MCA0754934.1 GtrA family protein [Paenibacillus vietnamensis]
MSDLSRGRTLVQFVRFNLIGLLNTAIDVLGFALLTKLGVYYLLAQVLAYGAGMLNSLLLNSRFTFGAGRTAASHMPDIATSIRFVVWNAVVLGMSVLLLALLNEWLALEGLPAKAIVTVVSVGVNFYGSKRWVFARRGPEAGLSRREAD